MAGVAAIGSEVRAPVVALPVEKKTVCKWNATAELLFEGNGSVVVDPVIHQYRRVRFIEVGAAWPIDGEWRHHTIRVLRLVVRVVPGMTVLVNVELVCKRLASGNRTFNVSVPQLQCAILRSKTACLWSKQCMSLTLGDTVDTIVLVALKLAYPMPVDCRTEVRNQISDMHNHLITPASLKIGTGVGVVEELGKRL